MKKRFGFWLNANLDDEAKLLLWLDKQGGRNVGKYIKDLLKLYYDGKLTTVDQEDLQREKLIVDIKYKEICTKIKEHELIYRQTFDQSPPLRHQKAMKIHIETPDNNPKFISSIDEKNNRLMCSLCGACFVFAFDQHDKNESKEKFIDHYFDKHGEIPPQLQKELQDF